MPAAKNTKIENGKRILVVDDDLVLRAVAEIALTAPGFAVSLAEDGQVAIDMLTIESVDLILLDLDMPNLNGFDVLELVRSNEKLKYLPVIVVTGRDDLTSINRAFNLGATSFVTKPLDWNVMIHHINYILRASCVEQEVRTLKESAENASRLKSNMLSVIAHEFRTPIHVISGFGQLIKQETKHIKEAAQLHEYVQEIIPAAERLNSILSSTVLLSKAVGGDIGLKCENYNFHSLIAQIVTVQKEIADARQIELVCTINLQADLSINCDKQKLCDAVGNLISNAIKFSARDSVVTITVQFVEHDDIGISVHNNGSTLTGDQFQQALNPFSQNDMSLSRRAEGLGLGLPVAKVIAEAHDGFLTCQSDTENETIVSLVLPAVRVSEQG